MGPAGIAGKQGDSAMRQAQRRVGPQGNRPRPARAGPAPQGSNGTTEPAPYGTTGTLPPPSANGSAPRPGPQPPGRRHRQTWTSEMHTGLIAGFAAVVVAVIFTVQNAHAADISFLGVHLVLPLAAALLLAAVAGALAMAAAGPARGTRLRLTIRRTPGQAR